MQRQCEESSPPIAMELESDIKVNELHFRSLEIDGRESISTDISDAESFGIYAYEFTDGTWYVGKSKDVRRRHVSHMHEYRHMSPPLIPKTMLWASCKGSGYDLDIAEAEAIAWFEEQGYSLRNVLKTGRPRGRLDVEIDLGDGWGVMIPWERSRRPASKGVYSASCPDAGMESKYLELKSHSGYDEILGSLRRYVQETIPAPADTAEKLWVATAMPHTGNRPRIICISCQNAETLVILEEDERIHGFLNLKRSEKGRLPPFWKRKRNRYGTLRDCYSVWFKDIDEFQKMLDDEVILDCCYRVNAELMRRGGTMYRRYSNPYLMMDILGTAKGQ